MEVGELSAEDVVVTKEGLSDQGRLFVLQAPKSVFMEDGLQVKFKSGLFFGFCVQKNLKALYPWPFYGKSER